MQLTDELVAALDAEARSTGQSRSALVRQAVEHYLHEHSSAAIGQWIAEGYARVPPGTPDGWGDLEELTDQGTHELLQRLGHEEREAGHEPW